MTRLCFLGIEEAYIFLSPVEMQATNRPTVRVVQKNPHVVDGIPVHDPLRINNLTKQCFDNVKTLKLFLRGLNAAILS